MKAIYINQISKFPPAAPVIWVFDNQTSKPSYTVVMFRFAWQLFGIQYVRHTQAEINHACKRDAASLCRVGFHRPQSRYAHVFSWNGYVNHMLEVKR